METVTIEKMTYGIDSLGHIDGKVVFVPYGAPRETAEIDIKETRNDYLRGNVTKVINPSPFRQKSPCPNFPECGGCHWLHLFPETQRCEKEAYLNFLLRPLSPATVFPLEALPPNGYRNKMELKVHVDETGNGSRKVTLGNYRYRSHDVVPLEGCVVQCPPNMVLYGALNDFYSQDSNIALARNTEEIIVRTLGPQQQSLISLKAPPDEEMLNSFRGFFEAQDSLARLEIVSKNTSFLTLMREKPPFSFMKKNWSVSPRSFFQNNLEGAEAIYFTLLSIYEAAPQKGKFIDLYCGIGVQTALLESRFEEVVAVESNEDSYQDALKNQRPRTPPRTRFICRKAETIFGTPLTKGVIAALHMNPPRTGVSPRVMRGLSGIKPRIMTYLSCNPLTFKRDAQAIIQMGYRLEQVHAFDLFPGTFHLEILGTFTR